MPYDITAHDQLNAIRGRHYRRKTWRTTLLETEMTTYEAWETNEGDEEAEEESDEDFLLRSRKCTRTMSSIVATPAACTVGAASHRSLLVGRHSNTSSRLHLGTSVAHQTGCEQPL
jgi:hypothetical protein